MPSPTPPRATISPLAPLKPDLYERAWFSAVHPTLPLLATAHGTSVTVFSLTTLTAHSTLTRGHERSVRCAAWKPVQKGMCLVTGSFDSTAGLWRWEDDEGEPGAVDVAGTGPDHEWQFTLVLEGHDSEIKSVAFSPGGEFLATSSRDKTVWIWEDVGADDDEWETVAVLNEHEGDVKAVAFCPDVPGRNSRRRYSADVLASASYDDTVRIWREDGEGEWVCVAVLTGHEGTVWGIAWEGVEREDGAFPRLSTFSADGTIRVWKLKEEDEDDNGAPAGGSFGAIPTSIRKSLREEWICEAVLPKVHTRDIYSVAWSAKSGLLASTGSDGTIVVYQEDAGTPPLEEGDAAAEVKGQPGPGKWNVLAKYDSGHGPYEINHIIWCPRYDSAPDRKAGEEMLVTTGDDGLVRTWAVSVGQ
ncbi:related to human TAFII100 and other WD-40 repeat containing proteins [Cephalotrichum gorgonifer]|uniref:Probable cytosolic iron-sulfur protein assembly protein 1 n=1 Tax=Cephalotrichum gorgonifer TaxID=2041049 RepID=A0AAE8N3B1_9PEZI|nr:related to human TAFII100 and other WD-40 repeat containing proteins [Cephalotrichum gorgonifer]